jgi:hypothetical protein
MLLLRRRALASDAPAEPCGGSPPAPYLILCLIYGPVVSFYAACFTFGKSFLLTFCMKRGLFN